ncbi:Alpha/Beta hydrolase protein [Mycena vulgaris]|nr:Alpha/Beta hydrolase protein [Mycena vulgaris]
MCSYSSAIASSLLLSVSAASISPVVSLDYGTFLGAKDGNLTKFLGVPYSQPVERFELLKSPTALEGLRNATSIGPTCPQQALSPGVPFFPPNYTRISEDCLTLDVFTPAPSSGAKLPVLVVSFIFSGRGFVIGSSTDTDMRPIVEHSISLGEPVIVVTPNYRLSAFGFLAGKEATATGITNLGLRDRMGGVSAGAISTALHLLRTGHSASPALFHGAFMASGSPLPFHPQADGQPYYDQLVALNNCTAAEDTLACLRGVPYDTFLATVDQTPNIFSCQGLAFIWAPHVDGDVVVQNPVLSVSESAFTKIPIMTGDCDDEGTGFPNAKTAQIAEVMELYPQDPAQGSPFGTGTANQLTSEFKRVAATLGDARLVGPRRFFLEHASSTKTHGAGVINKRGKSTPYLGAYHGSDVPIFFPANTSVTDKVREQDGMKQEERIHFKNGAGYGRCTRD